MIIIVFQKPKANFLKRSRGYADAKIWNNLLKSAKKKEILTGQFKATLNRKS